MHPCTEKKGATLPGLPNMRSYYNSNGSLLTFWRFTNRIIIIIIIINNKVSAFLPFLCAG